jgi:hypothetical protein
MAKKETAIAKIDETEDALVLPADLEQFAGQGLEGIKSEDLAMPRLALAQGLSPQIQPNDPVYIDGLRLGDAFNSLTGEIYGHGPFEVAVVKVMPPRWVEFVPRKEGGGVKDLNIPEGDPRTQFTTNDKGERCPPVATKFYDFVVVFLDTMETIVLSYKSTGIKYAKQLNSLMKMRQQKNPKFPVFAGVYQLEALMDKNSQGSFANLHVKNAGVVKDEDKLRLLSRMFVDFKDKEIKVDLDPDAPGAETEPDM